MSSCTDQLTDSGADQLADSCADQLTDSGADQFVGSCTDQLTDANVLAATSSGEMMATTRSTSGSSPSSPAQNRKKCHGVGASRNSTTHVV